MDGNNLNNEDIRYIHSLSEIIKDSGEIGTFELGNLEITINSLESYENSLIINKEKKDAKN
jgi:predicted transport protein